MKRWFIRLSVLSVAGILGFIAIARAQRTTAEPAVDAADITNTESVATASAAAPPKTDPFVRPTVHEAPPTRVEFTAPPADTIAPLAETSRPDSAPRRDPFGLDSNASGPKPIAAAPAGKGYSTPSTPARYPTAAAPSSDQHAAAPPAAAGPYAMPNNSDAQIAMTPTPAAPLAPAPRFREANDTPPASRDFADPPLRLADSGSRAPTANFNRSSAPPADRFAATSRPAPSRFETSAPTTITPNSPAESVNGRPGGRQLEGPQGPNLILEKTAPAEIQVGKPTTFDIKVKNNGTVAAYNTKVYDVVPQGTRLLGTKPKAQQVAGGGLVWSLGAVEPGEEKFVELQLMPESEGEIGSVATVSFSAKASVRTLATKPQLKIDASAPSQVMIGDQITMNITVANLGTGAAHDVVLFESLPSQLRHPAGAELEFDVGDLEPKESRAIALTLTAARPGVIQNILSARGDGSLTADASVQFEIIAPALDVSIEGPTRRYLERQATYTVQVANPGTAPAKEIELVSRLPRALKFVSANNAGHYDEKTHAVYWSLEELPEGEQGNVKLVTLPMEPGEHTLRVESTAKQDLSDSSEETIHVEGLSALFFEVVDVADPVEVGGETTYEIRVLNQGTKTASNIVVAAVIPPEMKPMSADGPTQNVIEGGRVLFAPLPRLAPKADTTYTIRVRGLRPGDQRVHIQIQSDELQTPVTKEESTRVYADR